MKKVIFSKETRVNKKTYAEGKTLRVSDSIYQKLVDSGEAKELKPKERKRQKD